MVEWHHRLNGHEIESTPGVDDGQGGLVFCSPWGREESDTTERLQFHFHANWRRKWQPTPVLLPGESQGRGAWWAAVYGVAQSRTRLMQLSSSSSSSCEEGQQMLFLLVQQNDNSLGFRRLGLWLGHATHRSGSHWQDSQLLQPSDLLAGEMEVMIIVPPQYCWEEQMKQFPRKKFKPVKTYIM